MKSIKWTGLNMNEIKDFVNNEFSIVRDVNDDNTLILASSQNGTIYLELGDVLTRDHHGEIIVLDQYKEESDDFEKTNDEDLNDFLIHVMGVPKEEASHINDKLKQLKQDIESELFEDTSFKKSPFNSLRKTMTKASENSKDIFNQFKEDLKEKSNQAQEKSRDVYERTSDVIDNLKQRHKQIQQQEDDLFKELRESDDYKGLNDKELKRLVQSRVFFKNNQ
jgi:hypothetical protein